MKAILTDIEGTTSSIAFVAEVLFPYARARLADYVAAHPAETAPILAEVAATEPGDAVATLLRWIDEEAAMIRRLELFAPIVSQARAGEIVLKAKAGRP